MTVEPGLAIGVWSFPGELFDILPNPAGGQAGEKRFHCQLAVRRGLAC